MLTREIGSIGARPRESSLSVGETGPIFEFRPVALSVEISRQRLEVLFCLDDAEGGNNRESAHCCTHTQRRGAARLFQTATSPNLRHGSGMGNSTC